MTTGPRYLIELRAERSDVPAVIRLRHALKRLLRSYQLRALSVAEVGPGGGGRGHDQHEITGSADAASVTAVASNGDRRPAGNPI